MANELQHAYSAEKRTFSRLTNRDIVIEPKMEENEPICRK